MSLSARFRIENASCGIDVDLHVPDRHVVAIVGDPGIGKTALVRALAGFDPVESGKIVLDDEVLEDSGEGVSVPPRMRPTALVQQEVALFENLNAVGNIAFGLRARGHARSDARREAVAWLERLGIRHLALSRPAQLSERDARWVAIARSLATRPRLVLLDDPMARLDGESRRKMRAELTSLVHSVSTITLLVTGDPDDAAAVADTILEMRAGRPIRLDPVGDGTPVR